MTTKNANQSATMTLAEKIKGDIFMLLRRYDALAAEYSELKQPRTTDKKAANTIRNHQERIQSQLALIYAYADLTEGTTWEMLAELAIKADNAKGWEELEPIMKDFMSRISVKA